MQESQLHPLHLTNRALTSSEAHCCVEHFAAGMAAACDASASYDTAELCRQLRVQLEWLQLVTQVPFVILLNFAGISLPLGSSCLPFEGICLRIGGS